MQIDDCKSPIAARTPSDRRSTLKFAIFNLRLPICLFLVGCVGPLDDEYYMRLHVPPERTHVIETLTLPPAAEQPTPAPPVEPPAVLELTVEEARAAALANNLELQVALIDPTISRQSITEAEAAFEALLFGDATFAKNDRPRLLETVLTVPPPAGSPPGTPPRFIRRSGVVGITNESIAATPGVLLPLTTGGTLRAAMPVFQSELDDFHEAGVELSISQPLLRGAGPKVNTHGIRVAKYNAMVIDARTKLQVMSVLADIDRLYWRLYGARRELEVRKHQYDLAGRQLERARNLVNAGQVAEVEITRAESGVAEGLEGIIVAEGVLQERERELKRAMNRPDVPLESWTIIVPTTPPNPVQYHLDAPKLAEMAMQHRMELLEDEIELARQASEIDFQRNAVLPMLNLDYTYGINGVGRNYGQAFDALGSKKFEDHVIGVRAELPLGNMAARSALYRALYTRIQRVTSKAGRELTIRQEVLDAVGAINTNWQRILAAQRRTILAQRTLEAEQRQFELGLRTSTEVIESQFNVEEAQLAEVQAIADYEIAQVDLAVATGTLLGATRVRWEPIEPDVE